MVVWYCTRYQVPGTYLVTGYQVPPGTVTEINISGIASRSRGLINDIIISRYRTRYPLVVLYLVPYEGNPESQSIERTSTW